MAKRILIETSILALFCVSCLPGEAQDAAGKKKVALGPTGVSAPRVVRAGTVPLGTSGALLPSTVRKSYPSSRLERGLLFKQQGKIDDALLEFILSVQENPTQVRAFYEQAEIFKQKGKPVLARSALEQALAIAPGYTQARSSLVQLHVQSGNLFGAASEMGRMLGLNNDSKPAGRNAVSSAATAIQTAPSARTASPPGRPGLSKAVSSSPPAKADSLVNKIVAKPASELRAEPPVNDIQDPARTIASWLAPEQARKDEDERTESKAPPGAVTPEALPGATPSFEAVAASLGLSPQSKDAVPEAKTDTAAGEADRARALPLQSGATSAGAAGGSTSSSPAAASNVAANVGQREGLLGRTMTALRHPPMPHLFGRGNDSGHTSPVPAPSAAPRRILPSMPVAGWMKTLSNPLRSGAPKPSKHNAPDPSSLLSMNAAAPSAVTITRIATPAENEADKRNEPSSPESLSPQLQKMLAAIMPSPAPTEPTAPAAPVAAAPSAGGAIPDAVARVVEAAGAAGGVDQKASSSAPVVPLDNRPKPPYGLLKSNASSRMPDLAGDTVVTRNATIAAQPKDEGWMSNMMKKASAMMPKMPDLPKLPELPRLSIPSFFGGHKEQQTPQAVASAVAPVLSASPPASQAPADLRVIPADVRNVLSKVEGARAIDLTPSAAEVPIVSAAPAVSAPPAVASVPSSMPSQNGPMDALPDVVKNILGGLTGQPTGQTAPSAPPPPAAPASAAPPENSLQVVVAPVPAETAPAQPGPMAAMPDVVKNILGGLTGQSTGETAPIAPPPPAASASAAPPENSLQVVVAPVPAETAPAQPGPMDAMPDVVKNILGGLSGQPQKEPAPPAVQSALSAASAGADPAANRPPSAPAYLPPQAPTPVPVDVQNILSKLSLAIPQQAASFFHLRKSPSSARVPVVPGGIDVSGGMIQPIPGSTTVKPRAVPPSSKGAPARPSVAVVPAQPLAIPRKDVPEALPSVVKDILNKVDAGFVPTVVATVTPGQYVPAPVQLEKSSGEGPQPIASPNAVAVLPAGPAPALAGGSSNMFDNVPVPEMRPQAPRPVPVNVQAILGKIPSADPGSAKLNLKQGAAALLPQPGTVKLNNSQPVIASAPQVRVDVQAAGVQTLHPSQVPVNVLPGQVPAMQHSPSLPVMVRDVLRTAEAVLPPSISAPAAATRAFVVEPLAMTREEVQAPSPIASVVAPFAPAAAPAPVGADLSKHFSGVVPEVRPQAQLQVDAAPVAESAPAPVAVAQSVAAALPPAAPVPQPAAQPYSGPKLTNARSTRSGAFTYMHPVLDTDRLFGTGQLRTIPAAAAKTEKPKAPAPPPEDAITKRMRYLLAHGTQNLKPGEAFMYSEETGEGILFMPGGGSERRKLSSPQDHDQVLQNRRPDILEPKDLQYSLSLLGKLLPAGPHPEQTRGAGQPINPGPSLEQLMDQTGKGFFGWVKDTFKWGGNK